MVSRETHIFRGTITVTFKSLQTSHVYVELYDQSATTDGPRSSITKPVWGPRRTGLTKLTVVVPAQGSRKISEKLTRSLPRTTCQVMRFSFIGFSRGAFTARSVAAIIISVGLLTVEGMVEFYAIFKDWEHQADTKYKSQWPDRPFPNKPSVTDPAYGEKLHKRGLTSLSTTVRAIGVWDTVGALRIPGIAVIHRKHTEYSFIDNKVSPNIQHAFQALALDEYRKPFGPSLWHKPEGQQNPVTLKQCRFPGVHSNVGGSYGDTGLADITLVWMIAQFFPFLDFDLSYINTQRRLTMNYYRDHDMPVRSWGLGKIYDSMAGIERLAGKKVRTPGRYCAMDRESGETTKKLLSNTEEYIHSPVRVRKTLGGPGPDDKGTYIPLSLAKWDIVGNPVDKNVRWVHRHPDRQQQIIPEDEMSDIELQLLALSRKSTTVVTEGGIRRAPTLITS
ncbi:MAG: hypothetical protein Q9210_000021 [Variospora velana]